MHLKFRVYIVYDWEKMCSCPIYTQIIKIEIAGPAPRQPAPHPPPAQTAALFLGDARL